MSAASDAVVWGLEIMLFNFLYFFYNFLVIIFTMWLWCCCGCDVLGSVGVCASGVGRVVGGAHVGVSCV